MLLKTVSLVDKEAQLSATGEQNKPSMLLGYYCPPPFEDWEYMIINA